MVDPRHGALRLARGALANAGIFALACGAHLLGGGSLPDPVVLAALAAFAQLACTAIAPWTSLPALLAVLGGGQLVLHHVFAATTAVQGCAPAPAGHHHGVLETAPACSPVAHAHGEPGVMLAAHAVATVVSAVLLRHGDRALLALARFARLRLVSVPLRPVPVSPRRPRGVPPVAAAARPVPRIDVDSVGRRGPPAWLLAA